MRAVVRIEVDPHHPPPRSGAADLREAGVREDLPGADVHLAPGDLLARLGDHRVRLERSRAALAGEGDGGGGEVVREAAAAVALADREARHRPDLVVVL